MARPVGTSENPSTLVKRELKEGLKQQGEIRKLVQGQISAIEKQLGEQELPLEQRLVILGQLAAISGEINKGIAGIAKWVIPATGQDEASASSAERIEVIMKELLGK